MPTSPTARTIASSSSPRPAPALLSSSAGTSPRRLPAPPRDFIVVSDIEAARKELRDRGVDVSEVFHADSVVHSGKHEPFLAGRNRVNGAAPERQTYGSYASFSDPDGNGWLFQEVTTRLPGRVEGDTTFSSSAEIASALRRAAAAHGEHEKRNGGQHDVNWPDWYADYIAKEQAGEPLPL